MTHFSKCFKAAAALALCAVLAACSSLPGSLPSSATPESSAAPASSSSAPAADGELLTVRFLDVGQADSALIRCGDDAMLIDGGNVADSSLVASVLQSEGLDTLDVVAATHAHEDHVGGLSGALNVCTAQRVIAPVTQYYSQAFSDFVRYTEAQGLSVEVPAAGDTFSLGGAQVTVLGPVREYDDTNNTSLVLRVDFGSTSFLFTGDMERNAEEDLLAHWGEDALRADVLKTGHHGSDTSTSYPFLRAVMPQIAVISVGAGNSYGHPDDAVLSRLSDEGAAVYRTDECGDITVVSDGETLTVTTQKHTAPDAGASSFPASSASAASADEESYIGNLNSKKFHLPSCSSLPKEDNRVYFATRDAAVEAGYTPCGLCNP